MKLSQVSDFVQIVTGVAVLIGLGLVVFELRQARTLTQSQLASEGMALIHSRHLAVIGEDLASTLARACTAPTTLSKKDGLLIDHYFKARWAEIDRVYAVTSFGFEIPSREPALEALIQRIMSYPQGKAWIAYNKPELLQRAIEIAERTSTDSDSYECASYLGDLIGEKS